MNDNDVDIDEGSVATCTDDGWFVACASPPELGDSLRMGKSGADTVLTWDDEGITTDYRLYRGYIQTGASFEYNQTCTGSPITATTTTDATLPPAFHAFYYLVARENDCGQSILHRDSDGLPVPNDDACSATVVDSDGDGVLDLQDNCPAVSKSCTPVT